MTKSNATLRITMVDHDRDGRELFEPSFKITVTEGDQVATFWGPTLDDIADLYADARERRRGELVELGPFVAVTS